ncbi:hypothetical protein OH77DRAFT_1023754 [Trametes cingulata]|nr:hypothetical protein OH77DRAFT_1023754 [Trametes cingulata]
MRVSRAWTGDDSELPRQLRAVALIGHVTLGRFLSSRICPACTGRATGLHAGSPMLEKHAASAGGLPHLDALRAFSLPPRDRPRKDAGDDASTIWYLCCSTWDAVTNGVALRPGLHLHLQAPLSEWSARKQVGTGRQRAPVVALVVQPPRRLEPACTSRMSPASPARPSASAQRVFAAVLSHRGPPPTALMRSPPRSVRCVYSTWCYGGSVPCMRRSNRQTSSSPPPRYRPCPLRGPS